MALNYISIGSYIRGLRKKQRITQSELADRIDRSVSYVSRIESGEKSLSLETLVLIANALNTSADYLLTDNLNYTPAHSNVLFSELLADCTEYERRVLYDTVVTLKHTLRENRKTINRSRK